MTLNLGAARSFDLSPPVGRARRARLSWSSFRSVSIRPQGKARPRPFLRSAPTSKQVRPLPRQGPKPPTKRVRVGGGERLEANYFQGNGPTDCGIDGFEDHAYSAGPTPSQCDSVRRPTTLNTWSYWQIGTWPRSPARDSSLLIVRRIRSLPEWDRRAGKETHQEGKDESYNKIGDGDR